VSKPGKRQRAIEFFSSTSDIEHTALELRDHLTDEQCSFLAAKLRAAERVLTAPKRKPVAAPLPRGDAPLWQPKSRGGE
jgi:hypothetical protein